MICCKIALWLVQICVACKRSDYWMSVANTVQSHSTQGAETLDLNLICTGNTAME